MEWRDERREEALEMSHMKPKRECPCFACPLFKECNLAMMMECKKYMKWYGVNGYSDHRKKKNGLELIPSK